MTNRSPRSCLVHGPSGCGKTTYAQAIAKALGVRDALDKLKPGNPAPLLNTLLLSIERDPNLHFKGRAMSFNQAIQIARQQGAVV